MITLEEKKKLLKQVPAVIWFTGLSGAGKSTIAEALEWKLYEAGYKTQMLDGDIIRNGINKNLGFSIEDRIENIRRISEVSKLLVSSGIICLNSFISPTNDIRRMAREIIGNEYFMEIYVNTPLEICEARDVKGLYKAARAGAIKNFTGITSPYEPPINPDLSVKTEGRSVEETVKEVYDFVIPRIKC